MSVAATGFFDGVHLGHQKVLSAVRDKARELGKESQIVTFWPHPRSVLQQQAYDLRLLTSLQEKEMLFSSLGIDKITVLDFTREFSRLSTEQFLRQYLVEKCGVSHLVIGYDHRIGHDQGETQSQMIETCRRCGIETIRVEELVMNGQTISSTKIRRLLEEGNVVRAAEFLGRKYALKGVVISGNHLGRTIGFPTANLGLYNPLKLVPMNGVYAVDVLLRKEKYRGICNIGVRPTVNAGNNISIETHILDFDEDIYGLDLVVEFVGRIREEVKFPSLQALKAQLEKDKADCLKYFL
ncbi:MAG: bifunctional riboflavin kinase/FAD synthetase [Bacteroidales bacterium]|nr:bifunctional riboflavin kinase/FAD synthetase [Bacteroidales bacterium]